MVGPVGPQGPGSAALVRDAAGTLVGSVLDIGPTINGVTAPSVVALVRQVGGRSVWFTAGPSGFLTDTIPLNWESNDCTGTPLLSPAHPSDQGAEQYAPFVPRAFVPTEGTTGFYQIGDLKVHSISSDGFFADAATCASNHGRSCPQTCAARA